jgi:uncharacterized protein (UPF0332 family)
MTPEADRFLAKAHKHLDRARVTLGVDLHEGAGRAAYLASFHAAQASLFERVLHLDLRSQNRIGGRQDSPQ